MDEDELPRTRQKYGESTTADLLSHSREREGVSSISQTPSLL